MKFSIITPSYNMKNYIQLCHNSILDQNVDLLKRGVTLEEIDLPLTDEQALRLERLLKNGQVVKFRLMGQEDAVFTISDEDRQANLDVIKYYKQLDLAII